MMDYKELIEASFEAQKNAYAPYSNFNVGASLLTKQGKIYVGANIENASYPAGICAERVAMSKAIAAICISCSGDTYPYPCGVCRQFMSEFSKDLDVIVAKSKDEFKIFKLTELLPHSFDGDCL